MRDEGFGLPASAGEDMALRAPPAAVRVSSDAPTVFFLRRRTCGRFISLTIRQSLAGKLLQPEVNLFLG